METIILCSTGQIVTAPLDFRTTETSQWKQSMELLYNHHICTSVFSLFFLSPQHLYGAGDCFMLLQGVFKDWLANCWRLRVDYHLSLVIFCYMNKEEKINGELRLPRVCHLFHPSLPKYSENCSDTSPTRYSTPLTG